MKLLNFCLFLFTVLVSCTKNDGDPETFEGFYKTNALLDISCVALDPELLPTVTISKKGLNTYTIKLHRYTPKKSETTFSSVSLEQKDDKQELFYDGKKLGDWNVNHFFENKPKLVTLYYNESAKPELFVYFVGEKK